MTKKATPQALISDHNSESSQQLAQILNGLGIASFNTPEDKCLEKLSALKLDLLFLDISEGTLSNAFALIQEIRTTVKNPIPLFIVSASSDSQSIAHAIELGANDFIIKPIDKEILASKLRQYVQSDELSDARLNALTVPRGGDPATLELELAISTIDELGITLRGRNLFTKSTVIRLGGNFIAELTGKSTPLTAKVVSTSVVPQTSEYDTYAEFETDDQTISAIRRWLMRKVLLLLLLVLPAQASAETIRISEPNQIGIEVLGRSILYGLQYDRAVNERWAIGMGLARITAEMDNVETGSTLLIPIYANYYLNPDDRTLFATFGVTLLTSPSSVENRAAILGNTRFPERAFLPTLGLGYEARSSHGFLFRTNGYGTLGDNIAFSFGFALGYTF